MQPKDPIVAKRRGYNLRTIFFKCKTCGIKKDTAEKLKRHERYHTDQNGFKTCLKMPIFKCKTCGKIKDNAYQLKSHERSHNKRLFKTCLKNVDESNVIRNNKKL